MKRFANSMVTVSCLLVGAALLCGNQLQGLPYDLFAQSKPLGRMTDKDLAAVWGGDNGQCAESSYLCATIPAVSCNNAERSLGADENPCSQSNVINGKAGTYYFCGMLSGAPNDQHCGSGTVVYCQTLTTCMSNKIQGTMYNTFLGFPVTPYCKEDGSSSVYCGHCSSGSVANQDGHSSQRCVPNP